MMHFSTGWVNDNRLWKMTNSRFPRAPVDTWCAAADKRHPYRKASHQFLHGDLIYVCINSPAGESRVHRVESRSYSGDITTSRAIMHAYIAISPRIEAFTLFWKGSHLVQRITEISTDVKKKWGTRVKSKRLARVVEQSSKWRLIKRKRLFSARSSSINVTIHDGYYLIFNIRILRILISLIITAIPIRPIVSREMLLFFSFWPQRICAMCKEEMWILKVARGRIWARRFLARHIGV